MSKRLVVIDGKAFQITDDILGIYGDQKDLGKTPGDDQELDAAIGSLDKGKGLWSKEGSDFLETLARAL